MGGQIYYGSEETQNRLQRGLDRIDISGNVNVIVMTPDDFNDKEAFMQRVSQASQGLGYFTPPAQLASILTSSSDPALTQSTNEQYFKLASTLYDGVEEGKIDKPAYSFALPFEKGTVGIVVVDPEAYDSEGWFLAMAGIDEDGFEFDVEALPGNSDAWLQMVTSHELGHITFGQTRGMNFTTNLDNETTADLAAMRSQFTTATGIGPMGQAFMSARALGSINNAPNLFEVAENAEHATNLAIDDEGNPVFGGNQNALPALAEIRTTAALFAAEFEDLDEDENYIAGRLTITDLESKVKEGEDVLRSDPQATYFTVKAMYAAGVPPSLEAQTYMREYLAAAERYLPEMTQLSPEDRPHFNRGVQEIGAMYEDVHKYAQAIRPETLTREDNVLTADQINAQKVATVGETGPVMR